MGYTHYWYRRQKIEAHKMKAIGADFSKVMDELKDVITLADGCGQGEPVITDREIVFNGVEGCGHPREDLGIAWPSSNAGGISDEPEKAGQWFAGTQLAARTCGGDCSHETMTLTEEMSMSFPQESEKYPGLFFQFCKTAFKPYDLAVIALLIIAKHHLNKDILIHSDGTDGQWFDGKFVCNKVLGYGLNFSQDKDDEG